MRDRLFASGLAVVLLTGSGLTGTAAELSERRFIDWNYYNNAGWRALNRGDFAEAARRFSLAIDVLRPEWDRAPRLMAHSYADLAWAVYKQGRADDAEPLARWALEVRLVSSGPDSEPTAQSLYELALIQDARSQLPEAEALLRRSIAASEKCFGPYDLRVTFYLTELARFLVSQRKLDQAESIYRRVLGRPERALPASHPFRVVSLIGLGRVYTAKGETIRAGFQDAKVLPLLEHMPASDYADVAGPLSEYVGELKKAGRIVAASQLEDGARAILAQINESQTKHAEALARVIQAAQRKPPWDGPIDPGAAAISGLTPAADSAREPRSAPTPPLTRQPGR